MLFVIDKIPLSSSHIEDSSQITINIIKWTLKCIYLEIQSNSDIAS